jgi:hypothetical protein
MFLLEWREFPSAPCFAEKQELDESSLLEVVEIALTCFRACFLPGRAKDLSAPGICILHERRHVVMHKHSSTQLC